MNKPYIITSLECGWDYEYEKFHSCVSVPISWFSVNQTRSYPGYHYLIREALQKKTSSPTHKRPKVHGKNSERFEESDDSPDILEESKSNNHVVNEGDYVSWAWGWTLGAESGSWTTVSKKTGPQSYSNKKWIPPTTNDLGKGSLASSEVRILANNLIAAVWDPKQRTQITYTWTPEPW